MLAVAADDEAGIVSEDGEKQGQRDVGGRLAVGRVVDGRRGGRGRCERHEDNVGGRYSRK